MSNKLFGKYGEDTAEKILLDKGYVILYRNFTCKLGEIDIIAEHKDYIVFIEVKARKTLNRGHPLENITYYKQRQLIKTALFYIDKYDLHGNDFRFDVIAILFEKGNLKIEHIQNAFEAHY